MSKEKKAAKYGRNRDSGQNANLKGRARAIRRIQQGVTAPQDVGHVCTRHGITPAEANGKPEKAPHHVVYPWKAQLTKEWYAR